MFKGVRLVEVFFGFATAWVLQKDKPRNVVKSSRLSFEPFDLSILLLVLSQLFFQNIDCRGVNYKRATLNRVTCRTAVAFVGVISCDARGSHFFGA